MAFALFHWCPEKRFSESFSVDLCRGFFLPAHQVHFDIWWWSYQFHPYELYRWLYHLSQQDYSMHLFPAYEKNVLRNYVNVLDMFDRMQCVAYLSCGCILSLMQWRRACSSYTVLKYEKRLFLLRCSSILLLNDSISCWYSGVARMYDGVKSATSSNADLFIVSRKVLSWRFPAKAFTCATDGKSTTANWRKKGNLLNSNYSIDRFGSITHVMLLFNTLPRKYVGARPPSGCNNFSVHK